MKHVAAATAITLAMTLSVAGCSSSSNDGGNKPSSDNGPGKTTKAQPSTGDAPAKKAEADPGLPTEEELAAARKDVAKLSTQELAGQLVVGQFSGTSPQAAAAVVRQHHLAGAIFMGENIPTDDVINGVPALVQGINDAVAQDGRDWPALIGMDQEGGPVRRIKEPVTALPPGMAFGAANNAQLDEKVAKGQGQELKSLGINMVMAPDADVTTGPGDVTIAVRSPSSDPQRVGTAATGQVKGFQEAGIIPVLKHFPGHGSVTTDTHRGLAVQTRSVDELTKTDWAPFKKAIDAGAPAIMTAHIVVKDVDPNVPATLSHKVLTDELRNKMGFKGLIVTDAMDMGALDKFNQNGAGAASAIKAGADLILMPRDAGAAVQSIVNAVNDGSITRERLIDSAARIVATLRHQKVKAQPTSVVGSHQADAEELAKASITQVGGTCGRRVVGDTVKLEGGTDAERQRMTDALRKQGVTVGNSGTRVGLITDQTYNAGQGGTNGGSSTGRAGGDSSGPSTAPVQIDMGVPYAFAKLPTDATGFAAYSNTATTLDVAAQVLVGKVKPRGTLPVDVGTHKVGYSACN